MQAMILAAGLGNRMRPLTAALPKPLLTVAGCSLLEHHIVALRKAGITEIVINVSYRAEQIVLQVGDGSNYGVNITYCREQHGPYGTGGGIRNALSLLGDEAFLLLSADIYTDYSFANLVKQRATVEYAHLVMVDNPGFHPEGDFCLAADGKLGLQRPALTYANMALLHPRMFSATAGEVIPKPPFALAPLLRDLIRKRQVTGEHFGGVWHNLGTPQQLAELREKLG